MERIVPIERKHRLPDEFYTGQRLIAYTACIEHRLPLFNEADIVSALVPMLASAANKFDCTIPVYTFMPDHVHILALGESATSDSRRMIASFKHASGGWFQRNAVGARWQSGFWDHLVREHEGWESQARYIASNPCRAHLVEDPFDWPHTGSIGHELKEVLIDAYWK